MSDEKVPYIKRLENQRDALLKALKAVEEWHKAEDRVKTAAYKSDAKKGADIAKVAMIRAIAEAKNSLGGLYA